MLGHHLLLVGLLHARRGDPEPDVDAVGPQERPVEHEAPDVLLGHGAATI